MIENLGSTFCLHDEIIDVENRIDPGFEIELIINNYWQSWKLSQQKSTLTFSM